MKHTKSLKSEIKNIAGLRCNHVDFTIVTNLYIGIL